MRNKAYILTLAVLLLAAAAWADEGKKEAQPKLIEQVEFMTGFAWHDKLKGGKDYNSYPLIVDLDFNLKPLLEKINLRPSQLVQFQIEPYLAFISSPDSNFETGTSLFLKLGILPETSKFQPYVKAGTGISYMTLHTLEQGTQFNFISTGALGCHYYFTKNTAVTLEGRYRHLSNAGMSKPNSGINSTFIGTGVSYKF